MGQLWLHKAGNDEGMTRIVWNKNPRKDLLMLDGIAKILDGIIMLFSFGFLMGGFSWFMSGVIARANYLKGVPRYAKN